MTTYQTQSSFAEIASSEPLSEGTLAYFRERQRSRIHELVISEFLKSGMTKANFARRIGRDPAQITRWLANPGNWELDTISDFLLGISGGEFDPKVTYPAQAEAQNQDGPAWLTSDDDAMALGAIPELDFSTLIVREFIEANRSSAAFETKFTQEGPSTRAASIAGAGDQNHSVRSRQVGRMNDNLPISARDFGAIGAQA